MQAWRRMAADEYPSVLRRNSRWRPIARIAAKQAGWTFTDGFLSTNIVDSSMEGFVPWGSASW
jgi:hypothetical protein